MASFDARVGSAALFHKATGLIPDLWRANSELTEPLGTHCDRMDLLAFMRDALSLSSFGPSTPAAWIASNKELADLSDGANSKRDERQHSC